MSPVEYRVPSTLEEAVRIVGGDPKGTKLIAGGTDLIPQMRNEIIAPEVLVDLKQLALDQIEVRDDGISIGSCVTHTQITNSDIVRSKFPALAFACNMIGGPATRNRGTIGGNLVNASPAADSAPPLLAYDASVMLSGLEGERNIPLADFFLDYRQVDLQPGEILKQIDLPFSTDRTAAKYIKVGNRRALTISVIGVAACVTLSEDGLVNKARIALASVAPVPFRASAAEGILEKKELTTEAIQAAAHRVAETVTPISDVRASAAYRKQVSEVLVRRVLTEIKTELLGVDQA